MTQYYCHVCEQNVNAIDTIKPPLTETKIEQKDLSDSSHPHHQLECELCHQSYIEEVEQPSTPPAASAATVPPQPTVEPVGQLQMAAQVLMGRPMFNLFSSPPFGAPMQQPAFPAPHMSAVPPFPFPFPFPFPAAQHINSNLNLNNQPPHTAAPFPFSAFPFPFSAFSQPNTANLQPVASHPANYALNNTHFNQLLSSFLHPVQTHQRGLHPTLLARLQRRTVATGEERKEACVVCQCEVECGEEVVALPGCGHCFHGGCIEPWLKEHDLCPTCRKQVTAADLPSEQSSSAHIDSNTGGGNGDAGGGDSVGVSGNDGGTTAPDAAR